MTDPATHLERLFPGDSEMAERMRAFDWSASALGPTRDWPENLRVAVRLCLTSRFPICLWWGRALHFLYNDAFLPWLGDAKHPRALMQPGREVWAEVWDTIGPMLARVTATGEATWSEDTELYYNGKVAREEVYITWSYTPILAADGQTVDGIFCPCSETTEKVIGARRLETLRRLAVRAGEARSVDAACGEAAAVLGENTRDVPFAAIYVVGAAGDDARLSATALSPGEHRLPATVRAPDDDDASAWPLARVLRTKRDAQCIGLEARGVGLRAGPWRDLTRTALVVPIQASQDHLAGLLVVGASPRRPWDAGYRTFFDLVAGHVAMAISGARAYEAERQRAEELAQLDRAKTALFSNVSHEFRTPLTLMLGPIEDMLASGEAAITIPRGGLDLVHRNALRLLKLVNTLLDFSRIHAGRAQAAYEPLDLSAYTAELASMFRAAAERAGLRMVVDCPDLGEPVYVDRSMWEKIVLNLLSNAFKFTFEGEIEVSLRRDGEHAELSVRDTGTGIAASELPRIFERFHRIEGARGRTHEGSGIGLALVQELATLHGGSVRAESVHGQGSRFTVTVLLGRAHLPPEPLGPAIPSTAVDARAYIEEALRWLAVADDAVEATSGDDEAPGRMPPRILFADDNADLREYVQRLLSERYRVSLAGDGEAALTAALRHPPDLVLADVMMSRLDGFGLLRALRKDARTRNVPVILLSARAGEEARVEGLAAGANDYVIKPFAASELLARVQACLEFSRGSRDALHRERTLRQSAEDAETRTREQLATELAAMNRLHELSARLLAETELQPLLEEVLDASMALLDADFGSVQLYDDRTGALTTVAQRGLIPEFLDYFDQVREGMGAAGEALRRRQRVIVQDVRTEPLFQPHLGVVGAAGFRAVQSTPMFGRRGQVLGMISTYFRRPHRPSDHELRFADLYARQAVVMIERKQAEDALRASEERFRRYFDLGLIGMAITSPSRGCLEVNDELCRILGYERHELLHLRWDQITHPDDVAADVANFDRVMAGEIDGYSMDKRFIRKDRRVIDSIMAARCVRRADGTVDFFVGLIQDITDRKEAERKLTESERRFRLLLESIPHHVWSYQPDRSRAGYWNQRLADYTGLPAEELQQGGWAAVHPDEVERAQAAWQTAFTHGTHYEMEQRLRGRDGRYRRFFRRGVPVPDGPTHPVEWFGTDSDVEDRRLAEEALHMLQAELAHVARVTMLGELAASIAHELNQPLAAVVTNGHACIRWLAAAPPNLQEAQDAARRIVRDANHAAAVIAGIRTFLTRGAPRIVPVQLHDVISEVVGMIRPELSSRDVMLRVAAPPALSPVAADRIQVLQVILNLAMNAVESMTLVDDRPRTLDITTARHDDDALRLEVRDSGVGFAPKDHDRLFQAFYTTKADGLGMGLAISRSIVEAHGGRLWAAANDGPGVTFHFTLPVAR